ncbi:hypothetical protein A2859_00540 [Candidatus Roizmanbacteria bacterium RIFCSPHIGHO2_01_FULL_37_16b]|nr:MAG: hypothetical protein A2859_00540 [Candidatus Roizmanbacteria bacterium RIFCSPHIGHO2_01_FULL_37_16b]
MEKPRKYLRDGSALFLMILAACAPAPEPTPTEVEQITESPVVICHDGTQPRYPNAIVMIYFRSGEKGDYSFISQSFEGSPVFQVGSDGGLIPFKSNTDKFIRTGLDGLEISLPGQEIDLGGCLVDDNELEALQRFFNLPEKEQTFQPKSNNISQVKSLAPGNRNPMRGLRGSELRQSKVSKPIL